MDEARNEADQLAKLGDLPEAMWLTPAEDESLVNAFKRKYGFSSPASTGNALKAEALLLAGRFPEARAALDAAERAAPPAAPRGLYAKGMIQLNSNDVQGAMKTADDAIKQAPELAVMYELRAQARLVAKNTQQALIDIDKACKLDDKNFRYHLLKGQIRLQTGDGPGAMRELDDADRLAPRTVPHICVLRAQLLINSNRAPDALKAAMKGLVVDPNNADCLYYRGFAAALTGDKDWEQYFQKLFQTQGGQRLDYFLNYVELLVMRGNFPAAEKICSDLLNQLSKQQGNQEVEQAKLTLAFQRMQCRIFLPEKLNDALDDVNALLQANPNADVFLAARAFILASLGREGFVEDAKRSSNLNQQLAQQIFQRGQIAAQSRAFPITFTEYFRALGELVQDKGIKAACLKVIGLAYMNREQFQDALDAFKKSAELNPQDPDMRQLIPDLQKRLGNK